MKTSKEMVLEQALETSLNEMELYEFIMASFNIILSPTFWAERNNARGLDEKAIRRVTLKALTDEFGKELSDANTRAEKSLKKACTYMVGLYEAIRLRLMLFYIADTDVKRMVYLLKSEVAENRFGGLRSLRLNKHQAESLSAISKEIGNFLAEWYHLADDIFPEEEILSFLEGADDKELTRILFLLNSGEEKNIHGGLKSLALTKKQCENCKAEGIDTVITMVSDEIARRESKSLIAEFSAACEKLDDANSRLQNAGFTAEEIKDMLKCTNAYKEYIMCKKAVPAKFLKNIA